MRRNILLLIGLLILFGSIAALFLRVNFLEARQKAFASLPANAVQTLHGSLQKVTSSDYVSGNPQGEITLIEYSDFECPSCQRMHPIYQKLLQEFNGHIRFVQRLFPLPQNKNAEKEAEAALCAGKVGKYWQYGDEIYSLTKGTEGGEGFPLADLVPLAKHLGLSTKQFQSCLDTAEMAQTVDLQKKSGENAGVNELPSLFVIDKKNSVTMLSGEQSLATLQTVISYTIQE